MFPLSLNEEVMRVVILLWGLLAFQVVFPLVTSSSQRDDERIPRDHVVKVQLGSPGNLMRFFPAKIVLRKGERYLLFLSNPSQVTHEFASETFANYIVTEKVKVFSKEGDLVAYVVGDMREVELLPGGFVEWIFVAKTASPHVDLFCDIPGHRDAGMVGEIQIQN
jgi:uncharacterized cupredoxin-like copper-binding protein